MSKFSVKEQLIAVVSGSFSDLVRNKKRTSDKKLDKKIGEKPVLYQKDPKDLNHIDDKVLDDIVTNGTDD